MPQSSASAIRSRLYQATGRTGTRNHPLSQALVSPRSLEPPPTTPPSKAATHCRRLTAIGASVQSAGWGGVERADEGAELDEQPGQLPGDSHLVRAGPHGDLFLRHAE